MTAEPVPLSSPIAPVPDGQDHVTFHASLTGKFEVEDLGTGATIWSEPTAEVSALAAPVRARVRFAPAGAPGGDGVTPVTEPTLVVQTWLWELAALRDQGDPGSVPAVLSLTGVDRAECVAAATAIATDDPSYADLDPADRATLLADYEAGTAALLVPAGALLGAGTVDLTHAAGYRQVALSATDLDGAAIATVDLVELLSALGDPAVSEHPAIDALRGPLHPAVLPVEGGVRVRYRGTGLSQATTVTIAGAALSDLWADATGAVVYGTAPPSQEGSADLVVDGVTHAGAVRYTTDAVAATNTVMQAMLSVLGELRLVGEELTSAGDLTDEAAGALASLVAGWEHRSGHLIAERLDALGLSATPNEVQSTIESFGDALIAARDATTAVLRGGP